MLSRSYVKLWLSHLKSDAKTSWLVDLLSPETLKVGNVKVETKYWQIMMSRICPREIDETDRYDWSNITSSYIFQMRGSCCFALVGFFWHVQTGTFEKKNPLKRIIHMYIDSNLYDWYALILQVGTKLKKIWESIFSLQMNCIASIIQVKNFHAFFLFLIILPPLGMPG